MEEPKDLWGVKSQDILARAQHGLHCSYSLVLPYRILMGMVSSECYRKYVLPDPSPEKRAVKAVCHSSASTSGSQDADTHHHLEVACFPWQTAHRPF